ncbi:Leucine--tRNA ligase [bacterium AB1]|nr:Leucine--tRNA ligase [bacterium AB1]
MHYYNKLIEYYQKHKINNNNFSIIEMFPYSSGYLHIGHLKNYFIGDIFYRYSCIHMSCKPIRTIGWDSFGLPAENAANKLNIKPMDWTLYNIKTMKEQIIMCGLLYDYDRELSTSNYNYFRTTQIMFELFYNRNIIYKSYGFVNWDPVDKTILSNEQVINGKGWRSGANIEKKIFHSWYFDLKKYANEMYLKINNYNWSNNLKKIQQNWIGQSNGYLLTFKLVSPFKNFKFIQCFTKAPEYSKNMTAIALSCEHELSIQYFLEKNIEFDLEKLNSFYMKTDLLAYDIFGNCVPVIITYRVYSNVGTGAVYCAPQHSENDKAMLQDVGLVYSSLKEDEMQEFENSKEEYTKSLIDKKLAIPYVSNKLKNWSISRQRVWGCPIPVAYCSNKDCNLTFIYRDKNINLERIKQNSFQELVKLNMHIYCKKCNSIAYIENETLDTFFDSCWYYMAYTNPKLISEELNEEEIMQEIQKTLNVNYQVDYYIGGIEHANLHLLYSCFYMKALHECFNQTDKYFCPFKHIINQGVILKESYKNNNGQYITYEDYKKQKEIDPKSVYVLPAEKMSKSKLNTINVNDLLKKHSIDIIRTMLMANYPITSTYIWDDKILNKYVSFCNNLDKELNRLYDNIVEGDSNKEVVLYCDRIFSCIKSFKMNVALANIHSLYNHIVKIKNINESDYCLILVSLHPFVPIMTDTIYYKKYNKYII